MPTANPLTYLSALTADMAKQWPDNAVIHLVCHGHSVPAGYFATPWVNTQDAYPHLLLHTLKQRFPYAVLNVIVTAIGGEDAASGSARFARDVLCHQPRLLTLDYGLNDRRIGLSAAEAAWRRMIEQVLAKDLPVILLTPSWDNSFYRQDEDWQALTAHAQQIRRLAGEYGVGLADSFARFEAAVQQPEDLVSLLSHVNHPSRAGHELIADEISKFFPAR